MQAQKAQLGVVLGGLEGGLYSREFLAAFLVHILPGCLGLL